MPAAIRDADISANPKDNTELVRQMNAAVAEAAASAKKASSDHLITDVQETAASHAVVAQPTAPVPTAPPSSVGGFFSAVLQIIPLALLASLVWLVYARKRTTSREDSDVGRSSVVTPVWQQRSAVQLGDFRGRAMQIAEESMEIVRRTKNSATRESRLHVMEGLLKDASHDLTPQDMAIIRDWLRQGWALHAAQPAHLAVTVQVRPSTKRQPAGAVVRGYFRKDGSYVKPYRRSK